MPITTRLGTVLFILYNPVETVASSDFSSFTIFYLGFRNGMNLKSAASYDFSDSLTGYSVASDKRLGWRLTMANRHADHD